MMKKQFISYCIFFIIVRICGNCVYAQGISGLIQIQSNKYSVLDSAKFRFTYILTFVTDSTKLNSTLKNQLFLLIGNNESKFYAEDQKPQKVKQTTHSDGATTTEGKGLAGTEVIKNFKTKKETITTRLFGTKEVFVYEEDFPILNWNITNQSMVILSYTCKKASTTFLGRQYEAWFTTDIPINNGPWKLGGLPGLILKATDIQNHYVFECAGIEPFKIKIPIVKFDWKYVSTTRKNLNKLIKNMHENPRQALESMGMKVITPMPKFPYNPIERE